jgi:hypothetical protein
MADTSEYLEDKPVILLIDELELKIKTAGSPEKFKKDFILDLTGVDSDVSGKFKNLADSKKAFPINLIIDDSDQYVLKDCRVKFYNVISCKITVGSMEK